MLLLLALGAAVAGTAVLALLRRRRAAWLDWPDKQGYFAMLRRTQRYWLANGWTLRDVPVPIGLLVVEKAGSGDCIIKCSIDPDTRDLSTRDFEALPALRGKPHTRILVSTATVPADLFELGLTRSIFLLHYKALDQVVRLSSDSVDDFHAGLERIGMPAAPDRPQDTTVTAPANPTIPGDGDDLRRMPVAPQTDAQRDTVRQLFADARALLPGDPHQAAAAFRKVLALDTGHVGALAALSASLEKTACAGEAGALLRHAISASPKNVALRMQLGHFHSRQRAWDPAADAFRHALLLKPGDPAAQNGLVLALARQNRPQDAVLEAETALQTNPGDVGLLAKLGQLRLTQGKPDAAASLFVAVLAMEPRHAGALGGLPTAYSLAGQNEAAVAAARQAIVQLPNNAYLYVLLGQMLSANHSDEAYSAFKDALYLDSGNVAARDGLDRLRQEHLHPVDAASVAESR